MNISPETSTQTPPPTNDRGYALTVYALYALGFFTVITTVIGLIIAYVKASTASDLWRSHFQFQIRTFWIGLLYFVAGFALLYFFIGAFIILWWTIWTLVRIIRGAILLHDQPRLLRRRPGYLDSCNNEVPAIEATLKVSNLCVIGFGLSRIYAIGDVHGCLDQLQRLVELCERDAGEGRSKLIFLGDYIDRGPDSRGVIEFLMDLQKWSPDEIICLRGNHEDLLLAALDGEDAELQWRQNGAQSTLKSYKARGPGDIPLKHIDWIRALPLFHDDGLRFFVHAGVHPDKPLHQQRRRDLLWIREPFLSSNTDFGRLIVHGHTPIPSDNPDQRINRLNIDTGAVYGRALTSAIFDTHKPTPVGFLSASHIRD